MALLVVAAIAAVALAAGAIAAAIAGALPIVGAVAAAAAVAVAAVVFITFAFGGIEEESALDATWEAGELGFAVYIGADFEIELVSAEESVGDVDLDFRQVDGFVVWAVDGEVGGAGAEGPVDYRDGFGVGGLSDGRG